MNSNRKKLLVPFFQKNWTNISQIIKFYYCRGCRQLIKFSKPAKRVDYTLNNHSKILQISKQLKKLIEVTNLLFTDISLIHSLILYTYQLLKNKFSLLFYDLCRKWVQFHSSNKTSDNFFQRTYLTIIMIHSNNIVLEFIEVIIPYMDSIYSYTLIFNPKKQHSFNSHRLNNYLKLPSRTDSVPATSIWSNGMLTIHLLFNI